MENGEFTYNRKRIPDYDRWDVLCKPTFDKMYTQMVCTAPADAFWVIVWMEFSSDKHLYTNSRDWGWPRKLA